MGLDVKGDERGGEVFDFGGGLGEDHGNDVELDLEVCGKTGTGGAVEEGVRGTHEATLLVVVDFRFGRGHDPSAQRLHLNNV